MATAWVSVCTGDTTRGAKLVKICVDCGYSVSHRTAGDPLYILSSRPTLVLVHQGDPDHLSVIEEAYSRNPDSHVLLFSGSNHTTKREKREFQVGETFVSWNVLSCNDGIVLKNLSRVLTHKIDALGLEEIANLLEGTEEEYALQLLSTLFPIGVLWEAQSPRKFEDLMATVMEIQATEVSEDSFEYALVAALPEARISHKIKINTTYYNCLLSLNKAFSKPDIISSLWNCNIGETPTNIEKALILLATANGYKQWNTYFRSLSQTLLSDSQDVKST